MQIHPGKSSKKGFLSPGKPWNSVFASPGMSWKKAFLCLYEPWSLQMWGGFVLCVIGAVNESAQSATVKWEGFCLCSVWWECSYLGCEEWKVLEDFTCTLRPRHCRMFTRLCCLPDCEFSELHGKYFTSVNWEKVFSLKLKGKVLHVVSCLMYEVRLST